MSFFVKYNLKFVDFILQEYGLGLGVFHFVLGFSNLMGKPFILKLQVFHLLIKMIPLHL